MTTQHATTYSETGLKYAEPSPTAPEVERARLSQAEQLRQYQQEQQRQRQLEKMQQERIVAATRHGAASRETVSGLSREDELTRRIRELEQENARLRAAAAPASTEDRSRLEEEYARMAQQLQTMDGERSKLIALSKTLTDNLAKLENLRKRDATQLAQLAGTARTRGADWESEATTLRSQLQQTQKDLERQQQDAYLNLRQMADEQEALSALRTERDRMAQHLVGTAQQAEHLRRTAGMQQMNMAAMTQRLQAAEQKIWELTAENGELRDEVRDLRRRPRGKEKAGRAAPADSSGSASASGSSASSSGSSGSERGKFAGRELAHKRRVHRGKK